MGNDGKENENCQILMKHAAYHCYKTSLRQLPPRNLQLPVQHEHSPKSLGLWASYRTFSSDLGFRV